MPNEQKPVITLTTKTDEGSLVVTGNYEAMTTGQCKGISTQYVTQLIISDAVFYETGKTLDGCANQAEIIVTNPNGTSEKYHRVCSVDYIAADPVVVSLLCPLNDVKGIEPKTETPRKVIGYVNTFVFPDGAYAVITECDGLAIECDWIGCEPRYNQMCSEFFREVYDDGTTSSTDAYVANTFIQFIDSTKKNEPCCGKPETCENVTCSYLAEDNQSTRGWHSVDDDCESLGGCCGDNCGDEYEDPHTEEWMEYRDLSLDVSTLKDALQQLVNAIDGDIIQYLKDKVGTDIDFDDVEPVTAALREAVYELDTLSQ